jgi:hypothetical protein
MPNSSPSGVPATTLIRSGWALPCNETLAATQAVRCARSEVCCCQSWKLAGETEPRPLKVLEVS